VVQAIIEGYQRTSILVWWAQMLHRGVPKNFNTCMVGTTGPGDHLPAYRRRELISGGSLGEMILDIPTALPKALLMSHQTPAAFRKCKFGQIPCERESALLAKLDSGLQKYVRNSRADRFAAERYDRKVFHLNYVKPLFERIICIQLMSPYAHSARFNFLYAFQY